MRSRTTGKERSRIIGVVAAILAAVGVLCDATRTDAGWFTRLVQEAGDAGGTVARKSLGEIDDLARALKALPVDRDRLTLAAVPSNAGHWTFVNRAGEKFTAASADEVARVTSVLGGTPAKANGLTLVMSEDAAFRAGAAFDILPDNALTRIQIGGEIVPFARVKSASGAPRLVATYRSNVLVDMTSRENFAEAVWQLKRPLRPADMTVVSLTNGPPPAAGGLGAGRVKVDGVRGLVLEAASLHKVMASLRHRTLIITGRIDGDILTYRAASGIENAINLGPVRKAAAENNVNLVLLHAPTPRQPGARNWFWQRTEVEGLDAALKHASYADFLNAVANGDRKLMVRVRDAGNGRTVLSADPVPGTLAVTSDGIVGTIVAEVLSETLGTVVSAAVEADVTSRDWQSEIDRRIVPGIPSIIQFIYLGSLVMGLIGYHFSRAWWFRLWPPEQRKEYAGVAGYQMARLARWLLFVLVFVPLVGPFALVARLATDVWGWVTLPFRLVGWMLGRSKAAG